MSHERICSQKESPKNKPFKKEIARRFFRDEFARRREKPAPARRLFLREVIDDSDEFLACCDHVQEIENTMHGFYIQFTQLTLALNKIICCLNLLPGIGLIIFSSNNVRKTLVRF